MSVEGHRREVPRSLAYRVLTRVLSNHEPLDEVLERICHDSGVAAGERAWLQDVCAGTLRWKGRLDLLVDSVALRKKPTGWLRKALLVAAYQLVVQDRAEPSKVVFETVAEVKRKEGEAPARFANAVLRKISVHAREYRDLGLMEGASASEAAAWASLPEWFWQKLVDQQGRGWAVTFAQACLERPETWIRLQNRGEVSTPGWVGESGAVPGSFRVAQAGSLAEKAGYREGWFFVQDLSSQFLVAEISGQIKATIENAGERKLRALDLCAAPGGKSAGLAWNGFEVYSTDRPLKEGDASTRYDLLRDTLARVAQEGAHVVPRSELAGVSEVDLAWVDAPCSGSGILRRHPDIRWLRKEGELAELQELQQRLLKEGWDKVHPGGFLAYSVCSVFKEEGPGAIERFIRLAGLPAGAVLKSWFLAPFEGIRGDGFWAALLRKPSCNSQ